MPEFKCILFLFLHFEVFNLTRVIIVVVGINVPVANLNYVTVFVDFSPMTFFVKYDLYSFTFQTMPTFLSGCCGGIRDNMVNFFR